MFLSNLKHTGKLILRPTYRKHHIELRKLLQTPRYTCTSTKLLERELNLVDSDSFLMMYEEIFKRNIYKFKAENDTPYIIDCGANIGLSVLYFKQLYPKSKIIAFEPDSKVFKILKHNIENFKFQNIETIDRAVWSSETQLEFMSEGADAGRLHSLDSCQATYQVSTVRLKDYLEQPVDFLKLDIEGAETEVLKDSQSLLFNVKNLFVEYHSFVDRPQTLHVILKILNEAGFRVHVHSSITSPQPFEQRNAYLGMDLQLNIFAFHE